MYLTLILRACIGRLGLMKRIAATRATIWGSVKPVSCISTSVTNNGISRGYIRKIFRCHVLWILWNYYKTVNLFFIQVVSAEFHIRLTVFFIRHSGNYVKLVKILGLNRCDCNLMEIIEIFSIVPKITVQWFQSINKWLVFAIEAGYFDRNSSRTYRRNLKNIICVKIFLWDFSARMKWMEWGSIANIIIDFFDWYT